MGSRKGAGEVDAKIAAKIRLRRVQLEISQQELGRRLGVTSQQVQKYETGQNRIAVSQLMEISEMLETPFSFFVEDLDLAKDTGVEHLSGQDRADTAKLVGAFLAITDPALRLTALQVVQRIASVFPELESAKSAKT